MKANNFCSRYSTEKICYFVAYVKILLSIHIKKILFDGQNISFLIAYTIFHCINYHILKFKLNGQFFLFMEGSRGEGGGGSLHQPLRRDELRAGLHLRQGGRRVPDRVPRRRGQG